MLVVYNKYDVMNITRWIMSDALRVLQTMDNLLSLWKPTACEQRKSATRVIKQFKCSDI